tara:strand:- start:54 stop:1268 length:1215 start_codon:yes stop_codon:yes gene_type:complete
MNKICVIGLGYVGLPICLIISKKYQTIGFDIDKQRIKTLNKKDDFNKEFHKKDLQKLKINFTTNITKIKNSNFYIICVPTPVTKNNIPDLNYIHKSFITISKILKKGDIVILESTVYPGVTDKFASLLEERTNLKNNKDFFVCYSPERINPGDKKNNLTKINKIFAIETNNQKIIFKIKSVYKHICNNLIITKHIKEAETAKVIENIQRDLNIAIFNEILLFCEKSKINFSEVIRLAKTKWNFIDFNPGLVGGHCLPVDPFYLSYAAAKKKIKTITTLAGRKTNDKMEYYVLERFKKFIKENKNIDKSKNILIIGLSYKYGVSDMRNSINLKIYKKIKNIYKKTYALDPFVNDPKILKKIEYTKIDKFDVVLFLSKGPIFKKIYNEIKKRKPNIVLDPFYYFHK